MRDRHLNGFRVQALGEVDGLSNRLARLARKPDDKVPMDQKAAFVKKCMADMK